MKTLTFSLILFVICYSMVELLAYTAYRIKFGEYKLYNIQHSKLAAIDDLENGGVFTQDKTDTEVVLRKQIIHPYVGFSVEGKKHNSDCASAGAKDCYARIKVATDFPLFKRSNDSLIIGILGGSFADGTARIAAGTFINEFKKSGLYDNRHISVYNLANGGYKQPQQLMNLAYYYSLGAQFDIVINLDGFNEMAASYLGYRDQGLHPSFPVHWGNRVNSTLSKEYLDLITKKRGAQHTHAKRANFWLAEGVRYSPLMNFIWRLLDQKHKLTLSQIDAVVATSDRQQNRDWAYEAVGPDYQFTNWQDFFDYVAQIWVDSSLSMRALAEGQGAKYYHFLQPNQYIKDSKILSDIERKEFVLEQGGYGNVYKNTHANIVKSAQRLTEQGVRYYDMTFVFKDIPDTLYIDNCCHLNHKGYTIIARNIVSQILAGKSL